MKKIILLAALVSLLCCAPVLADGVLSVKETFQEQNQWCWAGTSCCVLDYYGTTLAQCVIADYARTRITWRNFGSADCRAQPGGLCNYWNYNWGEDGSIEDILRHWGVSDATFGGGYPGYPVPLSLDTIRTEIDAKRPFILRWGWDGGGGHFLVGHGLVGDTVYYMNPWPGEGLGNGLYAWMCRGYAMGSYFTWTHTNVMTTTPSLASGDVNNDGRLNALDHLVLELTAAGTLSPGAAPCNFWEKGDLDNNGALNALDCALMRQKLSSSAALPTAGIDRDFRDASTSPFER